MDNVLELEIRRKIYTLILENPGLHAKKIADILSLQGQLADYHLAYLERAEIVTTVKEEGNRRYYATGKLGMTERRRISILRKEIPLRIILYLLQYPYSTHKEILEQLEIVKSTLSYHITKLLNYGLIRVHAQDKGKTYTVVNEKEIITLLIKYKPYRRMDSFKETWLDLKWPGVP
ncbi:MAG: winged helix-turn-helix transcriptional regulator [Methanobacteriota archaeon]